MEWEKKEERRERGFDSVDRPSETPQRVRERERERERSLPLSLSPYFEGKNEGRTDVTTSLGQWEIAVMALLSSRLPFPILKERKK